MPSVGAVGAIASSLRAKRSRSAVLKTGSSSSSFTSVSNNLSSVLTSVKGKASAVAAAAGCAVRQAKGKLDAVLQSGGASVTDPAAAATGAHPQESALCQLAAMGFSREAAECALLQLDGADVEEVADFLCEQERLFAVPPPVTQASDPELYWALQASLNANQMPTKPQTPWNLRPSTGTWLIKLPVANEINIALLSPPAPWFLRPSTGTWLAPLPVTRDGDNAITKADAEEEAVAELKDVEEKRGDDNEKLVAPSTQADAALVTDKLNESMGLPSPTRAGTIRGGA